MNIVCSFELNKCNPLNMNQNAIVEYKCIRSFQEENIFGKQPAYPSPKPTLTITSHLGQNVGLLGEG